MRRLVLFLLLPALLVVVWAMLHDSRPAGPGTNVSVDAIHFALQDNQRLEAFFKEMKALPDSDLLCKSASATGRVLSVEVADFWYSRQVYEKGKWAEGLLLVWRNAGGMSNAKVELHDTWHKAVATSGPAGTEIIR